MPQCMGDVSGEKKIVCRVRLNLQEQLAREMEQTTFGIFDPVVDELAKEAENIDNDDNNDDDNVKKKAAFRSTTVPKYNNQIITYTCNVLLYFDSVFLPMLLTNQSLDLSAWMDSYRNINFQTFIEV